MSQSRPYEPGTGRVPREKLEEAMQEVADYRNLYLNAHQAQGVDESLERAFHSALLVYYSELRPYRNHSVLGTKWEDARLYQDRAGNWVTGVDSLADFLFSNRTILVERDGYGADPQREAVPDYLDGRQCLRVSYVLDEIARELGVAIEVKKTQRPKGRVEVPDGGE